MGGVRGRPDGRRPDRPHRPPREARPVPRRVLPRPPCPHAGGLAAQKACALPMLRLLNFRCSFCSNPLDETHEHPQGAEGSREDRRLQALEGPGERHRLEPGPGIEDLYGRPLEGSPVPYVWLDATYVKEPTLLRDCFPQDSQSNIIPKAYLKPSPTGA